MSQGGRAVAVLFNLLLVVAVARPAFAQIDLSGSWANVNHEDNMERGPGPDPVDYLGLPLNDEARALALSYDYSSRLGHPDNQCGYYTEFYTVLGPFGLKIWSENDPTTGVVVAWKMNGWIDKDIMTIWMDGRPHPPDAALRTYAGFTTGVWNGDTLTAYTTHIKEGLLRRNGVPSSDKATIRTRITRHDDLLTLTMRFEDPVYLTEPHVVSRVWHLDPRLDLDGAGNGRISACEPIVEVPRLETAAGVVVPHYLSGKNPWINELTEKYNIPLEAVLGHAETNYPEYRQKMESTYRLPPPCTRYCCATFGVTAPRTCTTGGRPRNLQ